MVLREVPREQLGGDRGNRLLITLQGARQPLVAILLLISFFAVITGKPLDGLLMTTAAIALAWNAGLHAYSTALTGTEPAVTCAWRLRDGPPRLRTVAICSVIAVVFAVTVGSFTRYSWPATAGIAGLGAGVVLIGWGGPTRRREVPPRISLGSTLTWMSVLIAGSVWELSALFSQPSIETSSYAHPTLSSLFDPLLSSAGGRTLMLAAWIALGAYLVER